MDRVRRGAKAPAPPQRQGQRQQQRRKAGSLRCATDGELSAASVEMTAISERFKESGSGFARMNPCPTNGHRHASPVDVLAISNPCLARSMRDSFGPADVVRFSSEDGEPNARPSSSAPTYSRN